MTAKHARASCFKYFDAPFAAFAHRGGFVDPADAGRENSIFAFAKAVEIGFGYLETDVHATSDGKLIAFHDDRLDRVTDRSGLIAQLTLAQVKKARINGTDEIPTLDEVLEQFSGVNLNIDIKAPGAVEPLVKTINAHRAHERVCVGSFSQTRLASFRRLMGSQVATSLSTAGVAWTSLVPVLPRLVNFPGASLQVPFYQTVRGHRIRVVNRRLLSVAHARDMRVHVWTINDQHQMRELIELGVDGLMTDRPQVLKQVCQEYRLWR